MSVSRSRAGQIVSHYRIEERLTAGGMGEVYKAVDIELERTVVLKFLLAHLWEDEKAKERFVREAKAASALDHPNICTIYEIGRTSDDEPFIAMAFYPGRTLAKRVAEEGPLPFDEITRIAQQLCSGLACAHDNGIIHRDIKPENLMEAPDGLIKILDFGVAKLRGAATLTSTDATVGTLVYMSPEQCNGEEVDARADVWSVGAVLYELATGDRPFQGKSLFALAYEIANEDPADIDLARPGVPKRLKRVIAKALSKRADERFQTLQEMAAALSGSEAVAPTQTIKVPAAQSGKAEAPPEEKPAPKPEPEAAPLLSRTRLLVLAGLAAVVLAIALWTSSSDAPQLGGHTPATTEATQGKPRSLDYWITVQRYRDGAPYREPFRLDREVVFETGYRIFLHFEAAESGFLYLLNESPEETLSYNLLFPKEGLNGGEPALEAGASLQIPESGGFRFDDEVGTEVVWVVWARGPVEPLEAVKGRANPQQLGVIESAEETGPIAAFLGSAAAAQVERLREEQKTRLIGPGDVLVYELLLEHR